MKVRQDADQLAVAAKETASRAAEKQNEFRALAGQDELMTDEVKEAARAAVAGTGNPRLFWEALEQRRAAMQPRSTEFAKARQAVSQLRCEAEALRKQAK